MNNELKFVGYLFLKKRIEGADKLNEVLQEIQTYISSMDKLYIFNYGVTNQNSLLDLLVNYDNVEYADLTNLGQVKNYKTAIEHAISQNADYATILEPGYFYDDNCYHEIKKKIIFGEFSNNDAVITPQPVFTCEEPTSSKDEKRTIKGCHLVGTFINLHIYKQTTGFYEPYYQTTFDYDYCLMVRKMGYNVVLMNNLVLKNRNFKQLQKNILWHSYNGYGRDIYDVYYETRNRLHLWNKYIDFDPEYVKIDKKQQGHEFREMRLFEKSFKDKRQIINQARIDYKCGKMGKAFEEIIF